MLQQPEYYLIFPVVAWILFIWRRQFFYSPLVLVLGAGLFLITGTYRMTNLAGFILLAVYYLMALAIPYYYTNYWRERNYQCQLKLLPLNRKEEELLLGKSQQEEIWQNLQKSLDTFFEQLLFQQELLSLLDIKEIFQQLKVFFETNLSNFYLGLFQQTAATFPDWQLLLESGPDKPVPEANVFSSNFPVDRETNFRLVLKTAPATILPEMLKYNIGQIQLALRRAYLYQTLQHRSRHDELTGLYLRRYFQGRLEEEISRAKRYSEKFILLLLDIDYFKKVNDEKGHLFGDGVLRQVGKILRSFPYPGIQGCRYGGEEFLCLLPNYPAGLDRRQIAEKLRQEIAEKSPITVSIGVAEYPRDGQTAADLLKFADAALYQAKSSGRNRIV